MRRVYTLKSLVGVIYDFHINSPKKIQPKRDERKLESTRTQVLTQRAPNSTNTKRFALPHPQPQPAFHSQVGGYRQKVATCRGRVSCHFLCLHDIFVNLMKYCRYHYIKYLYISFIIFRHFSSSSVLIKRSFIFINIVVHCSKAIYGNGVHQDLSLCNLCQPVCIYGKGSWNETEPKTNINSALTSFPKHMDFYTGRYY